MQIALGSIGEMQKVPILCALAHDQGISNAEISPKHQGITEASLAKSLKDHSNKASRTNKQTLPHSCLLRDRPYQKNRHSPHSEFYSQATTCKQAHHSHTTNFPQPKNPRTNYLIELFTISSTIISKSCFLFIPILR